MAGADTRTEQTRTAINTNHNQNLLWTEDVYPRNDKQPNSRQSHRRYGYQAAEDPDVIETETELQSGDAVSCRYYKSVSTLLFVFIILQCVVWTLNKVKYPLHFVYHLWWRFVASGSHTVSYDRFKSSKTYEF